jgi:flagellar hook assembly protein FlgD
VSDSSAIVLEIPARYFLSQNHPNPFNLRTTLQYGLPDRAEVVLVIYDILGKQIRTLFHGVEEAGVKSVIWDGTDDLGRPVHTGVYLYKIHAGDFTQSHKLLLLK